MLHFTYKNRVKRTNKETSLLLQDRKKCFDFFLSETVITLEGFEKCAGAIFSDPLCPYMGMPQNGSQGQRVKIQTLSNMVILYIIRSKILF